MAEADFKPGDTDHDLLRKILDAILAGGGVGGGSVSLSLPPEFDVTGSGTGTISAVFASQAAGLVLASPAVGAGVPVFRALVLTDLPGGVGLGSVTSVGLAMPAGFTVSGSPVTTAGTITVTTTSQAANIFLASPSGSAGAPTFRTIAAADLPVGTGTVTSAALTMPSEFSVAGSPITTTGTFAITKATQTANIVYAGPASGGAVVPTFRALVTADMPAGTGTVTSVAMTVPSILSVAGTPVTTTGTLAVTLATQTANTIFAGPSSAGPSVPTFRTLVTADMPAGTGTVTSVALTMPTGFTISGSPVTTSGTLGATLASQSQKVFLASPTASSGAPTFRALVYGDVPEIFEFALSDETTAITTGTAKLTWRAPRALTVTAVRASLSTASSSGIPTVDINEGGTTILSTKLTIDANEKTSTTAATAAVISDTALADDAEITFDIDVAGTGATGLKVKIYAI